jgi:hypothetical protein
MTLTFLGTRGELITAMRNERRVDTGLAYDGMKLTL